MEPEISHDIPASFYPPFQIGATYDEPLHRRETCNKIRAHRAHRIKRRRIGVLTSNSSPLYGSTAVHSSIDLLNHLILTERLTFNN
jgi:hypothetical protein